jgi:hypothetical protein
MNKNLMIAVRVSYMFGGPFVAMFLQRIIGNKASFIILISLLALLIANAIYQTLRSSNSTTLKAWLYRLCVWVIGILLAQFMHISFGGILIYLFLFISFLFTYMEDYELISFVEDFVSDKRIVTFILFTSAIFILGILYILISSGFEGMLKEFQQLF